MMVALMFPGSVRASCAWLRALAKLPGMNSSHFLFGEAPKNACKGACASRKKPLQSCRDSSAQVQNRHAHGETVGDLIENNALQAVGDFAIDLDPAIDRTRSEERRVGKEWRSR